MPKLVSKLTVWNDGKCQHRCCMRNRPQVTPLERQVRLVKHLEDTHEEYAAFNTCQN